MLNFKMHLHLTAVKFFILTLLKQRMDSEGGKNVKQKKDKWLARKELWGKLVIIG